MRQLYFFAMKHRKIKCAKEARSSKKIRIRKQDSLLQKVYSLHEQGRKQQARHGYEDFISRYPRHAVAMGNYALLLHSMGQQVKAVALYQQAVTLSKNLDHLYYYLGNGLRELDRPREAILAYQKALHIPQHKEEVLVGLGQAYLDVNQPQDARKCFEDLQQHYPQNSQASYHLGLLFFQQEDFEQAVQCFSEVCDQDQIHIDACFNLALCYKALGRISKALDLLIKVKSMGSGDADILYNIGVLYLELHEMAKAEEHFLRALELDPENGIFLTDLAILYHIENRQTEAKTMYERAMGCGYESDSARHMLSALNGETTQVAPIQHVRNLFNNYASIFEKSLEGELQYTIPRQLAAMVQESMPDQVFSSALDLGCGTGLSGLAIRDQVRRLVGVDIAENMLSIAQEKKVYDGVYCIDIIDFLATHEVMFDLVFAADVLIYMGELESFFQHLGGTLKPGGLLAFSVETSSRDYCLRESGRYAHGACYLAALAQRFSFTIRICKSVGIRKERGGWVPGELFVMQYSSDD